MAKQTTAVKLVPGGRVPDELSKLEVMQDDASRIAALGTLLAELGEVPPLIYLKKLGGDIACAGAQIGDVIDEWEAADWGGPVNKPTLATAALRLADTSPSGGDELADLLSAAYRSNRVIKHGIAALYLALLDRECGRPLAFDPSWVLEGINDTARAGYEALVAAGEAIGVDESDLARFLRADDLDAAVNGEPA